jgi:hypothetical protein
VAQWCTGRQAGRVELRVGVSSADIRAALRFTLTGPRREILAGRVLQPQIRLLPAD